MLFCIFWRRGLWRIRGFWRSLYWLLVGDVRKILGLGISELRDMIILSIIYRRFYVYKCIQSIYNGWYSNKERLNKRCSLQTLNLLIKNNKIQRLIRPSLKNLPFSRINMYKIHRQPLIQLKNLQQTYISNLLNSMLLLIILTRYLDKKY